MTRTKNKPRKAPRKSRKEDKPECRIVRVLEMTCGKVDDKPGLRIAWSRFTKAEMPIGGVRILIGTKLGKQTDETGKDGILESLADAVHMFENYYVPLFNNPEELSEAVTQEREKLLADRAGKPADNSDPATWPEARVREAHELFTALAESYFLKADPDRREAWIERWTAKVPEKADDARVIIDKGIEEIETMTTTVA